MVTHPHVRPGEPGPEPIGHGKIVTLNYTLRTNGFIRHIRSTVWGDEPLEYRHGSGRLLPALERALEGKVAGDRLVLALPPEQAYGERRHELQQRVPVSMFADLGKLEAGMCLVGRSEDGRRLENVMIAEVDEDNGVVLVDTNHPLAGMTLEFEIAVLSVRDEGDGTGRSQSEAKAGIQ